MRQYREASKGIVATSRSGGGIRCSISLFINMETIIDI